MSTAPSLEIGPEPRWDDGIEIAYLQARHMVIRRVKDPGQGFWLEEIRHTAMANPPDDPIRHDAYGFLIALHFVDDLIYDEKGDDLLLIKYLDAPSELQL